MIKEDIKYQGSMCFEGMTSIRAVIKAIDECASDRRIEKILYDKSRLNKIAKEVGYFRAVSDKYGFELIPSDEDEIGKFTLGTSHGGIIAISTDRTIPYLAPSLIKPSGFYAMIQGIEDPYNFGYSIRSLYACGCNGVILGERNWMSAAGVVCRSSAGASELIPMFKRQELEAADIFKELGYSLVCADLRTENELGQCALPYPLLLVVGGEKRGISKELLNKADMLVKIPYEREFGASLSAASATTMFAYEIMRQRRAK